MVRFIAGLAVAAAGLTFAGWLVGWWFDPLFAVQYGVLPGAVMKTLGSGVAFLALLLVFIRVVRENAREA
jgi:hypothetical protein